MSRAHVRTAVTNVEVIQSPRLLLVKGSLLEPAKPCGRRSGKVREGEKKVYKSSVNTLNTLFYFNLCRVIFCSVVFGLPGPLLQIKIFGD